MSKLFIRNFLIGLIFMFISAAIAAAVIAVLSLLAKLMSMPFNTIANYIVGSIVSLICFFKLKGYIIEKSAFFVMHGKDDVINDLVSQKPKNLFWLNRLQEGKFITKGAARATYIPCFVMSIAMIVFAVILYPTLEKADNYIGYAVICAIIGSVVLSWAIYGITGMRSICVCKKCGTVNAFIFDEYLDLVTASGFRGNMSYNSGAKHHGVTSGGWYVPNSGRVTKYGDMISRHCACCGDKSVYVCNTVNETKVIQPKNPYKG